MLANLGDELAMGIANATLQDVQQQQQLDVARNERLRIARDLHDTLGQNISYLRLKLEHLSIPRPDGPEPAIQDELAQMLPIAAEAYEQVRDTLEELRATEQLALEEAVRSYARPVAERAGFALSIHQQGTAGALSPKRARQLLYIVREGLNNVEKHVAATRVEIALAWHAEHLELVLQDDGVGFEPEQITIENRYGTSIMEERAQAMKGHLRLASAPGAGTTLTLTVPLSPHDRRAPAR